MNPTDTARALVEAFDTAVRNEDCIYKSDMSAEACREASNALGNARAALLAHVAGVEQLATFGARVLMQHHGDGERAALVAELYSNGYTATVCGGNGRPIPLASLRELVAFAKQLAAKNLQRSGADDT